MKKNINIMLVEDHPEYREVIQMSLQQEPDLNLVSVFGTAETALRSLQNQPENSAPDIILLDLNLLGMSGLEAIPWFDKYVPASHIIILTNSDREADILEAIRQGAEGYLLKSSTVDQIVNGIRTVVEGGASLDPKVAKLIIDNVHAQRPAKNEEVILSKRLMEVLSLLADGMMKKEIAKHLDISYSTVDSHVKDIYEKLNVKNAPSAISKAYKQGILKPDER